MLETPVPSSGANQRVAEARGRGLAPGIGGRILRVTDRSPPGTFSSLSQSAFAAAARGRGPVVTDTARGVVRAAALPAGSPGRPCPSPPTPAAGTARPLIHFISSPPTLILFPISRPRGSRDAAGDPEAAPAGDPEAARCRGPGSGSRGRRRCLSFPFPVPEGPLLKGAGRGRDPSGPRRLPGVASAWGQAGPRIHFIASQVPEDPCSPPAHTRDAALRRAMIPRLHSPGHAHRRHRPRSSP
nr:collagen alpha-1(I) chain-like [Peromyscus maniculatus bairdii]